MIYNNNSVRRQDRLLDGTEAYTLLQQGEYGVLSMLTPDNQPYGIPVNYVWDGEETIYVHCAPAGKKLLCIGSHPEVSFCVVGGTRVIPNKFTTAYESIVIQCKAQTGLPTEERKHALELLIQKYSPDYCDTGMKYAEKSFHRTEIIRLDLIEASGKAKRLV